MRHHRPTAGQPNPCIEFAKCQNDNPAIMRIAHFRPPAALTANNAVSRVRLLTFDAFRKENTALRHRLQPFARTPPDYVSGNMQHKVTSCFPFLEHYRLSTSIKISSRLYMNSRFTPEYSTTGRHLRPDMRRKKCFLRQVIFSFMRLIRCYAHSCMKKHKERLKYVILRGSETYRTHLFIPASLLFFVILLHFGIP